FRQPEIGRESAVTHVLRGVTTHAIVHEIARAALKRGGVSNVIVRRLNDAARRRSGERDRARRAQDERKRNVLDLPVNRHGTSPSQAPAWSDRSSCTRA